MNEISDLYSACAQDDPQEMERNKAKAKHVAWPSCAWLLLSLFPFPVGHPVHEHCRHAHAELDGSTIPIWPAPDRTRLENETVSRSRVADACRSKKGTFE